LSTISLTVLRACGRQAAAVVEFAQDERFGSVRGAVPGGQIHVVEADLAQAAYQEVPGGVLGRARALHPGGAAVLRQVADGGGQAGCAVLQIGQVPRGRPGGGGAASLGRRAVARVTSGARCERDHGTASIAAALPS
jgi:hypothetical protein